MLEISKHRQECIILSDLMCFVLCYRLPLGVTIVMGHMYEAFPASWPWLAEKWTQAKCWYAVLEILPILLAALFATKVCLPVNPLKEIKSTLLVTSSFITFTTQHTNLYNHRESIHETQSALCQVSNLHRIWALRLPGDKWFIQKQLVSWLSLFNWLAAFDCDFKEWMFHTLIP